MWPMNLEGQVLSIFDQLIEGSDFVSGEQLAAGLNRLAHSSAPDTQ